MGPVYKSFVVFFKTFFLLLSLVSVLKNFYVPGLFSLVLLGSNWDTGWGRGSIKHWGRRQH